MNPFSLAEQESRNLGHTFIGTEFLLLGLIADKNSLAAKVLGEHGVTLQKARSVVLKKVGQGSGFVVAEMRRTPRLDHCIDLAGEIGRILNQDFLASGHLLLAILLDSDGIALQMLDHLGVVAQALQLDLIQRMNESQPDCFDAQGAPLKRPPKTQSTPQNLDLFPKGIPAVAKTEERDSAQSVDSNEISYDDGLTRLQRQVVYTMYEMGLTHSRVAKVERLAKEIRERYAGEVSLEEIERTIRLMSKQDQLRYPLLSSQAKGVCISKFGMELFAFIDFQCLPMRDNYNRTRKEPTLLLGRLPLILLNGVQQPNQPHYIPPHNLESVLKALEFLIDGMDEQVESLVEEFQFAPDFPTGGVCLTKNLMSLYETGVGRVEHIGETSITQSELVISSLPHLVDAEEFVQSIKSALKSKDLQGISSIELASPYPKLRITIKIDEMFDPKKVLQELKNQSLLAVEYQAKFPYYSALAFSSLPTGLNKILSLTDLLRAHIHQQIDLERRRLDFLLKKTRERLHILEAYNFIINNQEQRQRFLDTIVCAENPEGARRAIQEAFNFSEVQANAMLEIQVRRFNQQERLRISRDIQSSLEQINHSTEIIEDDSKALREVLAGVQRCYIHADKRRTQIRSQ